MSLQAQGLCKSYGDVAVLRDVGFEVGARQRAALVGASGSGKSTLLRLLAGFARPDAGSVRLDGRVLVDGRGHVPAHRRGIGYVAQDGALFPHLTVRQNVAFGLPRGAARGSRVAEALELVDLDASLADRYPHALSGGQQQRVALARALAPRPHAILLDEPFSALDTGLREQTRRAVVEALDHAGVTAVLVTHDQEEALTFGHAVGVLSEGRLLQWGRPEAVFDAPLTPYVATFLGPALMLPARRDGDRVLTALGSLEVRHDRTGGSDGDATGDATAGAMRDAAGPGTRQGTVADGAVVAMVRPAQLELWADGSATGAPPVGHAGAPVTVGEVRLRGAETEVVLLLDAPDQEPLVLRRPSHALAGLLAGARARLGVADGVVVYPPT